VELPFLARCRWPRPPGGAPPRLVLDEHNIEFDLARQQARNELGLARRIYKLDSPGASSAVREIEIWKRFDGVAFCSVADEARARALVPSIRSVVVPNAGTWSTSGRALGSTSDGHTVIFFGAMNYFPKRGRAPLLLREVWPLIEKSTRRSA